MAKMSMIKKGILALGLASASLFGYEFNLSNHGVPVKWNKPVLECKVDESLGQEYKDAFFECAGKWSAALDGKIKFIESTSGKYDIYMTKGTTKNDNWEAQAEWGDDGNGNLRYCVVTLNCKKEFSRSMAPGANGTTHLDSTVLHEIGHGLGMKDLNSENAGKITDPLIIYWDTPTMFNGYSARGSHSILHLDDIRGIRKLYGLPEPAAETLFFDIERVANRKRHKNINLFKRLASGVYEFSSPVGREISVFEVDGDVFYGNPVQWKLPRGYHSVKAEYRGRVGFGSFLIGRPPKVGAREVDLPDMKF